MLLGHADPDGAGNVVHVKIVLTQRSPVARIVSVKAREGKFGKATCVRWSGNGSIWEIQL
jgi:hypothetical protein